MTTFIPGPEEALKRANESIKKGDRLVAFNILQDVLRDKSWTTKITTSILDQIMFMYLELCIELDMVNVAEIDLFRDTDFVESIGVLPLQNIVKNYLFVIEDHTKKVQEQSLDVKIDIEDITNVVIPEGVLRNVKKSPCTSLIIWIKFLWESYQMCIKLSSATPHLESLYHNVTSMAIQFCERYHRKIEFRKLCEKFDQHLEDHSSVQAASVLLSITEVQRLSLETGLSLLESAILMELWEEAHEIIKKIQQFINKSKNISTPRIMAAYYQKLASVFWKTGNHLLHATALLKFFNYKMNSSVSPDELKQIASAVLVATLSVPIPKSHPQIVWETETDKSPFEKVQQMATLLGLYQLTRDSLLKNMNSNIINSANSHARELYHLLEVNFIPLGLQERIPIIIEDIQRDDSSPLINYIPALLDVARERESLREKSEIYTEFPKLAQLSFHMESLLLDYFKDNNMLTMNNPQQPYRRLIETVLGDNTKNLMLQHLQNQSIRDELIRTNRGHVVCGNHASKLQEALDKIWKDAKKVYEKKMSERKDLTRKIEHIDRQWTIIVWEINQKITTFMPDIVRKLSAVLSEELRRLNDRVNEFNFAFCTKRNSLRNYTKELNIYAEGGLDWNSRAELSSDLAFEMNEIRNEMIERIQNLVPNTNRYAIKLNNKSKRNPFDEIYQLNLERLSGDFVPDLEFRFSWGDLIKSHMERDGVTVGRDLITPCLNIAETLFTENLWTTCNFVLNGLPLAGSFIKNEWRLIALSGAFFPAYYLFEKLTWDNNDVEKSFKRQYISHIRGKFNGRIFYCLRDAAEDFSGTYSALRELVRTAKKEMKDELKNLDKQMKECNDVTTRAKILCDKAKYLSCEMQTFGQMYAKIRNECTS